MLNMRSSELRPPADSTGKVFLKTTRVMALPPASLIALAKAPTRFPRAPRDWNGWAFVDRRPGGVAYWLQPRTPVGKCHGMGAKRRGYPETQCRALVRSREKRNRSSADVPGAV